MDTVNTLMDFGDLFLTHSDGQTITLTQDLTHLLSVTESTSAQNELGRNLINSDSGLRLLAGGGGGHEEELLAAQQQSETEEGGNIILEAVNPSLIVLGAAAEDIVVERASVITTRRRVNSKK